MGQTFIEKIAQAHMAEGPDRPLMAGDFLSIQPHHVMTHDNTSAVLSKFKGLGVAKVHDPHQPVFTLDHDIQNTSEENLSKYRRIEAFAHEQGIDFHPAGAGIGHQIMCEQGYVVPGSLVVASDSHSNMYGALGAVGTPVVRTDAAAIWATGTFWWSVPRTVQVVLTGTLAPGVTGKDVIIALCGLYNHEEVLNAALEFSGPGVASLSMDARLAIANMSTEWGALVGAFPCDVVTVAYFKRRHAVLKSQGIERFSEADIARWEKAPPGPDPDAVYAARIELDLAEVTPHVSGPDTVFVMQPLAEIAPDLYTGVEVGFSSLCTDKELTFTFVEDVIKELTALTPGPYIHIGGDEAASTPTADFVRFIEQVQSIVNSYGKQMVGWEEIAQANLLNTSIAQHWNSNLAYQAAQQGAQIIMSPASRVYMDMKYNPSTPLGLNWAGYIEIQDGYNWDPVTQVTGVSENDLLGVEAPLWSETLQSLDDIEFMAFPRLLGYAEIGWSPASERNWDEYKIRLGAHGPRLATMGVNYYRSAQVPWK